MSTEEKIISLSSLAPNEGARHRKKRVGFGPGSGLGKTCGKGQKGQNSRSGCKRVPGFEGGQMPIHRRLPKRGFRSRKKLLGENVFVPISLQRILDLGLEGEITPELMLEKGLARTAKQKIKVLAGCEVDKKLILNVHAISASARSSIENAGGEVRLITK